jgi:hypothetical protein
MSDQVLLHVSDWNSQDKYYQLSHVLLSEFKQRILAKPNGLRSSVNTAWDWFTDLVDYGDEPANPIKQVSGRANHTLDEYFLDWFEPQDSAGEWELA